MERRIHEIDCSLFGPIVRDWHLDWRGRSAGDSVDGNGQVVIGLQPRWTAKLDYNLVRKDRILEWRALMAEMRGRVNLVKVCLCDPYGWRDPVLSSPAAAALTANGVPHDLDAYFDGGAGYAYELMAGLPVAVAAGSDTLMLPLETVAGLRRGQHFSIADWLYIVRGVSDDGVSATVQFEPPLRRAAKAGTQVHLSAKVLMAFTSDAEGRAAMDSGGRIGQASLELVEWVNR